MSGMERGHPLSDLQDAARVLKDPSAHPVVPLPDRYYRDYVTLMVRDPHWVVAHWEVSGRRAKLAVCRREPGGQGFVPVHEAEVAGIGVYYVRVPEAGEEYTAFVTGEDGRTAASEAVRTPPGRVSDVEDETWLTIDELFLWEYDAPKDAFSAGVTRRLLLDWRLDDPGGSHFRTLS